MHPSLSVKCVVSQPFSENTYIVHHPGKPECLVVDPGFEPEKFDEYISEQDLRPVAILNTHGHSDHIAGNAFCKQRWPDSELIIGEKDAPKLGDADLNLSAPFGVPITSPPADRLVNEGDCITYGGIELEILDTPGHSVGHIVFVWKGGTPWIVLGGDVLFQGSVGRTDFPDGSAAQLFDSIQTKLFTLPKDSMVLPGHGPMTTVEAEIRTNPFVGVPAGYTPA